MKLKDLDKKFLVREIPLDDLEVLRTDGWYLIDATGKKYIDFFVGWCVGNIGWNNRAVTQKIKKFRGPDYVFPGYLYEPWAKFAALLAKIAPGKLTKSFRATGGTEAIEIALQAAMSHTKRHTFVSIEGSYHGHSIGALSIGASAFREWYPNLLPNCHKINAPLNETAALQLESYLKGEDVAAFIMEPVVCNLGVEIPTKQFMERAQALCKQYGTLFIVDEVATGFGRTGKLFASEHFNLKPDIMCLGKSIAGGYAGMGATIVTEEVARSMEFMFSFYSTFGWHPRSVEAALATTEWIVSHKKDLLSNVQEMSSYFVERLTAMHFAYPFKIRAQGLAIGVMFEEPGYATTIASAARKNGVLVCPEPDNKTFTIFPALTIDKKTVKKGLDILAESI